ncbi:acetyltransferase [Thiocapsa roseopersicina]|uniref:Sugar O-acyltransferase, sialic acid O-acetyltransferase NeuD family n=1 Tax=Thiocapsa roseopersicina TaxID=1058 RepID=A0A1H2QDZ6_THIRO|nr:acetyltransferase [Thiocapsa roseopersicina]SDW05028.1 sugar O-acyltransferase, sialic acid O-acetyltransferase NeuD family [Thiocapsa roseopersicina]
MKKIILAGNAITADILLFYLRQDSRYQIVAATVDDGFEAAGNIDEVPSIPLSRLASEFAPGEVLIIMAMGYNDLNRDRASLFERLRAKGYALESYIHPDARVYSVNPIGEGSIILPGAVVEPHAQVGANTMVWCNATLAHHCKVGDNAWIASGAVISGQAVIGANTFLGVNATVVNKVSVGDFNVVGGGALITKDTKANTVHLARSAEELRYSADDYVKFFGV